MCYALTLSLSLSLAGDEWNAWHAFDHEQSMSMGNKGGQDGGGQAEDDGGEGPEEGGEGPERPEEGEESPRKEL